MRDDFATDLSKLDRASLQAIEAEGTQATHDLAHIIVRESVKNKGQIDLARLDRGGPAVRIEVLKLLAKFAASLLPDPEAAPPKPHEPGTLNPQKHPTAAVKKTRPASTKTIVSPTPLHATKDWRDQCRSTRGFRSDAYRCGLAVSTTTALASMALLLILKS